MPGEPTVGYISSQRVLVLHHRDCLRIKQLGEESSSRVIDVSYNKSTYYNIGLLVVAPRDLNLLDKLVNILKLVDSELLGFNSVNKGGLGVSTFDVKVKVRSYEHLSKVLSKISSIKDVIHVARRRSLIHK